MNSEVYQHARYYEIAFGFVDAAKSVDLFEAFIRKYSSIKVRTVLDICCGPALQLRELARRKYRAIGLDCSRQMLEYLQHRAAEEQIEIDTINADMLDFHPEQPVDFCYIMMGSIQYVKDNRGLLSHLSSVARALRPGGLYLIENLAINWASPTFWTPVVWDMEEDGIKVQTTYQIQLTNPLEQTVHQTIDLVVDDNGNQMRLTDHNDVKLIFPQEFKTIVELHGRFEFLGFFERESTNALQTVSPDNIVLLRKRMHRAEREQE